MAFSTPQFLLLFLPAVLVLSWAAGPHPAVRRGVVLAAGIVFYSFRGAAEGGLLLALVLVTFVAGRALAAGAGSSRSRFLGLALLWSELLVLLALKLGQADPSWRGGSALPLGVSFYTLNLVGYLFDVGARRTAPAPSFVSVASFATFFPTVTSGPLLRFEDFERQRTSRPSLDLGLIELGVVSIILGLAKKLLVADPLGAAVEPLYSSWARLGFWDSWLAVMGYAYQLYFDFSGYTDVAVGVAALLGFRIPQNFDAPYTAVHIADFWQRWHMTMSRWFRDYMFLPLSRAFLRRRPTLEGADGVRSLCLVLTMVTIGLWHGATWALLAWGLYHGLLLAAHARLRRMRGLVIPVWLARASTFLAVLCGWVLLKSPSPAVVLHIWSGMAGLQGWGRASTGPLRDLLWAVPVLLIATNLRIETALMQPRRTALRAWALAALAVLSLLAMGRPTPYLYYRF